MTQRLCVDCKNMVNGNGCLKAPEDFSNPVDGGYIGYLRCYLARKPDGICGPEGRLFEPAGLLKRWFSKKLSGGSSDI